MGRILSIALSVAFLAVASSTAVGQELVCSNDADAVSTGLTAPRLVANASVTVSVEPKDGRSATVSALSATIETSDGLEQVGLQAPPLGTVSQATLALPSIGGRAVVTVSWLQSAEPGIAEACRGVDAYVLKVGPSTSQLRAYLMRVGGAQVIWNERRKRYGRALDRFADGLPGSNATPEELFAYVRSAAARALAEFVPIRRLSARYRSRVLVSRPPVGFVAVNADLARSVAPYDSGVVALFRALSKAQTLADLTLANRAFDSDVGSRVLDLRRPWSTAVSAAAKAAGTAAPAWVRQVGK